VDILRFQNLFEFDILDFQIEPSRRYLGILARATTVLATFTKIWKFFQPSGHTSSSVHKITETALIVDFIVCTRLELKNV
jgi:hypothetical protein